MNRIIKICGLSEPEHAFAAAEAGATHIGFVFAPSRRRVDPAQARRCIEFTKSAFPDVTAVGLFVDADPNEIESTVEAAGVDIVQLHNRPQPALIASLSMRLLPVVRTAPGERVDSILDYFESVRSDQVREILLDAYHPTLAGGTGMLADWEFAAEASESVPVVLAGGLRPDNVGDAIRQVKPIGVDVSSGIERDGRKNVALIQDFVMYAEMALAEIYHSMKTGASSQDAP